MLKFVMQCMLKKILVMSMNGKPDYKNLTISVKSIYEVYYKAIDEFKSWLKNRNPWLDEALTNRNVFTDVELIF